MAVIYDRRQGGPTTLLEVGPSAQPGVLPNALLIMITCSMPISASGQAMATLPCWHPAPPRGTIWDYKLDGNLFPGYRPD